MGIEEKYILGTEGSPDYLVVAELDGFRLGVKGLIRSGPAKTVSLCFRIRSVMTDGKDVEDAKIFLDRWPIPFEQISEQRASVVLMQLVNRNHMQLAEVIEKAQSARFADKVYEYFVSREIELTVNKSTIAEHILKQWFEEIEGGFEKTDIRYLFSDFVTTGKLGSAMENDGLTISTSGVLVKGVNEVWPGHTAPLKRKKSGKKTMAGGTKTKGMADNVVALNAHKNPKGKNKKKPSKTKK